MLHHVCFAHEQHQPLTRALSGQSDTACVDIFGVIDRQYLEILQVHLPAPEWRLSDPAALDLAPSVRISYIGAGPAGALLNLTSGLTLRLTHHYSDADVAPGKLDVVLVPGANPFEEWEEAALAWLKAQAEFNGGSTDILSVCTGMYICGKAGLLSKPGRKACGPRALQDDLASRFEGVEWVGREKRWVQDGNFWSCGESSPCAARWARHRLGRR